MMAKGRPEATVVIPAYNAARWLPLQLDALASQDTDVRFEVVIGDNGSTDATREVVAAWAGPFPVRLVDASEKRGASFARNVAAAAAEAEILLFSDADDLVAPTWVSALVEAVRASGGALVAGALHHERFNRSAVLRAFDIPPDPPASASPGDESPFVQDPPDFAGLMPTVSGPSFAVAKELYSRVGGMDSSYPGGSEETDLAWRIQLEGVEVVVSPKAIAHYRLRSTARAVFTQQRIQQRARVLLWVRYASMGMTGPSVKYSVLAVLKGIAKAPGAVRSDERRIALARQVGGNIGALQGMLRFRALRRVPTPDLYDFVS